MVVLLTPPLWLNTEMILAAISLPWLSGEHSTAVPNELKRPQAALLTRCHVGVLFGELAEPHLSTVLHEFMPPGTAAMALVISPKRPSGERT